jgi:hypothetical protein
MVLFRRFSIGLVIHLVKNKPLSRIVSAIGLFFLSICRASNIKSQQLRRFAVDKLKDKDVASRYYDELDSEPQGVQAPPLSLDEKCKKLEETIRRVLTNTIGYTRKQANKKWFDEGIA